MSSAGSSVTTLVKTETTTEDTVDVTPTVVTNSAAASAYIQRGLEYLRTVAGFSLRDLLKVSRTAQVQDTTLLGNLFTDLTLLIHQRFITAVEFIISKSTPNSISRYDVLYRVVYRVDPTGLAAAGANGGAVRDGEVGGQLRVPAGVGVGTRWDLLVEWSEHAAPEYLQAAIAGSAPFTFAWQPPHGTFDASTLVALNDQGALVLHGVKIVEREEYGTVR